MKNTSQKIKLGIFVTVGVISFIGAIFYVGQNKNLFSSNIILSSIFHNVNGLNVGNNVRFAGIKVGSVAEIQIMNDTAVKVIINVDQNYQKFIRTDSKMAIGSDGLMGDKLIDLTSGTMTNENIKDGDLLIAVKPLDIDGIMKSAQNTLGNIESLSKEVSTIAYKATHSNGIIHTLLDDKAANDRVKSILVNTDNATRNLADDLKAAQSNILLKGYFKKKKKENEEKEENSDKDKVENKKSKK